MIAFENHPIDSDDDSIDVVDLKGKRTTVTRGWLSIEGLAWWPDGEEIWFAGTVNTAGWADAIHAVTLSGKAGTNQPATARGVVGSEYPVRFVDGGGRCWSLTQAAKMSISL